VPNLSTTSHTWTDLPLFLVPRDRHEEALSMIPLTYLAILSPTFSGAGVVEAVLSLVARYVQGVSSGNRLARIFQWLSTDRV